MWTFRQTIGNLATQRLLLACCTAAGAALSAHAQVAGFSDVPKAHWAADSVSHLAAVGIIQKGAKPLGQTQPGAAKSATVTPKYDGNKLVTRYELAVTLYRFVQYIEHANAQGKSKYGADAVPVDDGPTAVKRLLAGGYIHPDSFLATDGTKPVTAQQLATAMAQVLERSSEKTTPIAPTVKNAGPPPAARG